MKEKGKDILVLLISLLAVLGIVFIMSTNIEKSVDKNSSISN